MSSRLFKTIYHHTWIGNLVRYLFNQTKYRLVPARIILYNRFKRSHGYPPDLKNPKTLNEKIVWLKLHDKTALHTQCADKFKVRDYVEEKIGDKYLVPLYFHTTDPKQLTPDKLPDTPSIIKANHDSSGGAFVFNKEQIDWAEIRLQFKKRLKKNYYLVSKEWQYKNIEPRIIVEKLLQNKEGNIPFDYKLHCINGKVRMIQVDMGRGSDSHHRNWYSADWKREPFKWCAPLGNGQFTEPSKEETPKPSTLDEMVRLSEVLAQPFCYARIDWYDVDGHLYFGEITFHHDGGTRPIEPKIWDEKLGSELRLPGYA